MIPTHPPREIDPSHAQLRTAFKIIIVLATAAICLAIMLVWRWRSPRVTAESSNPGFESATAENLIQKKFPYVDFSAIYPDLAAADIDRLQRDWIGLRYAYAPFVEFAPLPVTGRFINIVPAGFRQGRSAAPWPPVGGEFIVFVFGGSTTLGFGLPDAQTVVSALEEELGKTHPGKTVRCYNFGRGYYFSTQERALFESLLAQGIVPNAALFIDGLNEFVYFDGVPQLARELFQFTAPSLSMPEKVEPTTDLERAAAAGQIVNRYQQNVRLIEGTAAAYGVPVIFVGQPVPFLDFPGELSTYPFQSTYTEHRLCAWGYDRFKQAGEAGRFGARFLWCGDAFARANSIMYVDSIHYSRAGAALLAQCIAERASQRQLLP